MRAAKDRAERVTTAAAAADRGERDSAGGKGTDPAVAILRELARNDELYPKSEAADFETVLREINPSIEYEGAITHRDAMEHGSTRAHAIKVAGEFDGLIFENDRTVWVNLAGLEPGRYGSSIYAAVGDYALNTGRKFIGDPEGLSDIALRRRHKGVEERHQPAKTGVSALMSSRAMDAMLSSALRHGTTRHLAPHPRQEDGDARLGVPPLRWQEGDDPGNIRSLAETALESLAHHVPDIRDATYDVATGAFRDGEGQPISDGMFASWATSPGSRAACAGRRTLKGGALLNTLLRRAGEEGPGLLAQVLHQRGELVAGAFHGLGTPSPSPGLDSAVEGGAPDAPTS